MKRLISRERIPWPPHGVEDPCDSKCPPDPGASSNSGGRNDNREADQHKSGSVKKRPKNRDSKCPPEPPADTSTSSTDERNDKRDADRGKNESTKKANTKVRFDDSSDKMQNQKRDDGPLTTVPRFEVAADGWLELSGD